VLNVHKLITHRSFPFFPNKTELIAERSIATQ
jgi:hypothetical protein